MGAMPLSLGLRRGRVPKPAMPPAPISAPLKLAGTTRTLPLFLKANGSARGWPLKTQTDPDDD